jgi:hypothetical protein
MVRGPMALKGVHHVRPHFVAGSDALETFQRI